MKIFDHIKQLRLIKTIKNWGESLLDDLGILAAPAAAATLTGMSVFTLLLDRGWLNAALWVAIIFGASLEAAGYNSFKAFQIDGDYRKPTAYLIIITSAAVTIEGFLHQDFAMMTINIMAGLMAGVVYWSFSAKSASINQLAADIEAEQMLFNAGMRRTKSGKIVAIDAANSTAKSTANSAKVLRKNAIPPEIKPDILQLTFKEFTVKYAGVYAVKERSFYNWQKEFRAAAVLNGASN